MKSNHFNWLKCFNPNQQTNKKNPSNFPIFNCILIGSGGDFTSHLLVTFIVGAGEFLSPFHYKTPCLNEQHLIICCWLGLVLTYMLRIHQPSIKISPTLHHSRRAAGSAITQRRFLSPHFHCHPHLKALGLRFGTGPLDLQTCFRGQVRRESSFILSVASSVPRGETSFEILPFKWNITRFYNTCA